MAAHGGGGRPVVALSQSGRPAAPFVGSAKERKRRGEQEREREEC